MFGREGALPVGTNGGILDAAALDTPVSLRMYPTTLLLEVHEIVDDKQSAAARA